MARILLIEDHAPMRLALRFLLEQHGHEVREAGNGRQGLALYQDSVFDLVITDIIMPEMDGIGTVMALKRFSPKLKIIAMSAGGRIDAAEYLSLASKVGADRTLAKPFETRELLDDVEELVGKQA